MVDERVGAAHDFAAALTHFQAEINVFVPVDVTFVEHPAREEELTGNEKARARDGLILALLVDEGQ